MQPSIEGANKQPVNAAPLSGPGKVEGEGGKEPTVDDLLEESDVGEDGTSTPNGIPSSKTSVATTEPQVQTNDTSYPVDGDKYLSSCKTMPKVASHLANSRKLGQYAYRELIGIALLAANGTRWPTARIHDWIVKTFPGRYQKGIGRWESSLSAILSASPDFRGEKCPGSATRLEWTFTNATTRRRYATQFPEYCLSPAFTSQSTSPLRTPFQSRADAMEPTGPTHSLNSAARRSPSPGVLTRTPNTKEERMMEGPNGLSKDAQSVVCEKPSPTVETAREHVPVFVPYTKGASTRHVQNKDGDATGATSVFVPFDQQPRPTFAMEPGSGVRVETSFLNAFPEYAKPSIETMTQKQIDDKIAEIKKRPSRKHTFGQRLAFCRTHRKDVHNELEGVTRPKYTSRQKGDGGSDEDAEMHDMGSDEKDFEDIMDLPENSIPMIHEGQLAFRDGTLVNGKLPRSRVVHKVGRKYGI
ncbi:hypothetical protein BDV95DRAFT_606023 [Massariosphaeria phaeospora]|uniref:Fork-head domain-containing protein n=1 Tax=Massariosphaeria phaeospora TaxID=100035 RepID=A0A7C8IGH7_9PLEO|nr:hypothetical protein BDV95DRAFT_606023 [Massariosphaeria phaeospora]